MVIPLIVGAAIAAVGGLASGVLSSNSAKKLSDKARRALEKVQAPTVEELMLNLHDLVLQGEFTPEEAEIVVQEATQLEDVMASPEFRSYQTGVLGNLQNIVNEGGLDSSYRASLEEAKSDVANFERGQRESILANQRARGIGGSGSELAAQLQGNQSAANRLSQFGFDAAASADQRKLQAMQQLLSGAGTLEDRDFNQQAQKARAQDEINLFNTRNRQQQLNLNVANRNQAQLANLAERQRISDANTGLRNEEERSRANAVESVFQNNIQRAGGVAAQLNNQAQQTQQQGQNLQNTFGGIAQALGNAQAQQEQNELFKQLLASQQGVK